MTSIQSIDSLVLELPPSCLEFCPHDPQYAVVGTYSLERSNADAEDSAPEVEKSQSRSGSLILIRVDGDSVTIVQTFSTPFAILDVHFAPRQHTGPYLFGAATSTGSLGLYQLKRPDSTSSESSPSELHPWIEHLQTLQYVQPSTLITAFAWHPITADLVGITLSSGEIKICSTKGSDAQAKIATLPSHDLEAWTLAFQPDGKGTLSGGDDSVLKYCGLPDISLAQSALSLLEDLLDHQSDSQTTWLDRKTHGAGVTAILPLSNDILVTGSYDDHIRIIHAPLTGRKTVLAEMNLGGGVWRVKTLSEPKVPFREKFDASAEVLLLVSCMHAGTRIVKIVKNTEDWSFEVLAKFEEHKSMNYGSDIQPGHRERLYTFISTSFYDRLLCLWRF